MYGDRTKRAAKNVSITLLCQILYIIVSFVCRTVFTKILGAEYLGINGLFSNILTVLSFVELGIGSAIVYKMYKPLSEKDERSLCIYLNFYKKVYRIIILLITVLGILLIPFLDYLVNAEDIDLNITILYLLYLADTITSYIYVYKKSLLIADQKNYIIEIYTQIFNIIINIVQIVVLFISHQFILYLIVKIVGGFICNMVLASKVNMDYPFAKKVIKESINKEDELEFKKNIKGLLLGKIASISFDGTDNVFISLFSGVSTVGVLSNYTMILTTSNAIVNKVFYSLTSTVGKLSVESNSKHVESVFKKIYFVNTLIYGYMFVGMSTLLQKFVTEIWLDEIFHLPTYALELFIIEVCLRGISYPLYMTRTAYGKFYQLQWISALSAVLNIVLDFILGSRYGLAGIILATIVSRTITRGVDSYIVYKDCLKKRVQEYYFMHFTYLCYMAIIEFIIYRICLIVRLDNVVSEFVVEFFTITVIYWIVTIFVFRRTEEYKYYKQFIVKIIKKFENRKWYHC